MRRFLADMRLELDTRSALHSSREAECLEVLLCPRAVSSPVAGALPNGNATAQLPAADSFIALARRSDGRELYSVLQNITFPQCAAVSQLPPTSTAKSTRAPSAAPSLPIPPLFTIQGLYIQLNFLVLSYKFFQ